MSERAAEQEARAIIDEFLPSITWSERKIQMAQRIAAALQRRDDELARVREELEDGNGAYRAVMEEACAGGITYDTDDRLHCTCVPHLREGIKALKAQHEAALREVERLTRLDAQANVLLAEAQREIERLNGIAESHLTVLRDAETHMKTQAAKIERLLAEKRSRGDAIP